MKKTIVFLLFAGCSIPTGLSPVTYDGNGADGGTVPIDSTDYKEGETVTVAEAGTLTRTGYNYTAWNTAADGSGTAYTAGDTFIMPAGEVVLYAQWTLTAPAAPSGLKIGRAHV